MSLVGGVTVIDWFSLYSTSGCAPGLEGIDCVITDELLDAKTGCAPCLEGIDCVTTDELLDAKTAGLGWAPHAQVLAAGRTAIASLTTLESKPVVKSPVRS